MQLTNEPVWIGTSWKMNKTLAEAGAFVDALASVQIPAGVQPFVLPPHTALAAVRARLAADSPVLLGAQNAHWAPEGAWTGEISMRMAADAGATLVEIGHSERREHFAETDDTVAAKTAAAIQHGLTPLICVGEPLAVRDAGEAEPFIAAQVRAALSRVSPGEIGGCLVAYEPIWAIGESGRPATEVEIAPVMAAISTTAADLADGGRLRALLYGGSVNLDNAAALLGDPHADGLFVGRAAWQPDGFIRLLEIAVRHVDGGGSSSI
jgi:L-erythrulose 1-phosphate isomerase